MKQTKICVEVILVVAVVLTGFAARDALCADINNDNTIVELENDAVREIELSIDADRENIILENKAIGKNRQRLREAGRIIDKAKAGQLIAEIKEDISRRKSVIKDLKKAISDKKDRKNGLVYGKQFIPKRDSEAFK
jgi:hypothetical protein